MNRLSIVPSLILITCAVLSGVAANAPQEKQFVLGRGSASLALNADGALVRWERRIAEKTNALPSSAGEVHYAGRILKLTGPVAVSRQPNSLSFTYQWPEEPGLQVTVEHRLISQARVWNWRRETQIKSQAKLTSDLTVFVESGLRELPLDTWLPLVNGVGAPLGTNAAAAYRLAGTLPQSGAMLALPMIFLRNALIDPVLPAGSTADA